MFTVVAKTYFSNNIMIRNAISLARAVSLLERESIIVPPDAELYEVRSPGRVVLVPDELIFNVNRAFVPRPPLVTRRGVYERDQGRCAYCGEWMRYEAATLDHIVPLGRGGRSDWENLVTCCAPCNQSKGCRTPEEARMRLTFRPFTPKVRLRPE